MKPIPSQNTPVAAALAAIPESAGCIRQSTLNDSPVADSTATAAVKQFHVLSPDALLTLNDCVAVGRRSRASLYRDNKAGLLPFLKLGHTTRVRVGDFRKLIGV